MILSRRYKIQRSSFLLGLTLLMILSAGILSELFQSGQTLTPELLPGGHPMKNWNPLESQKIEVTNRLGPLSLEKIAGQWKIIQPRQLPADQKMIETLLLQLQNIKVKKLYPKDSLNLSHYSLDTPLTTLKLYLPRPEKPLQINFGLINSIDQSTYMATSQHDFIYQIHPLPLNYDQLDISALIDSSPISLVANQIQKIAITKYPHKNSSTQLSLERQEGEWRGKNQQKMDEDKTFQLLEKLTTWPGHMILDKRSQELEADIKQWLERPLFKIELVGSSQKEVELLISGIIYQVEHLQIKKGEFVLVQASDRLHPYIVHKSFLKQLNTVQGDLKELSLKKLFY